MTQGARLLQFLVAGEFLVLGLATTVGTIRHPNPRRRPLAIALGLMSLLPVVAIAQERFPALQGALARTGLILFVGSGFALMVFRHRLLPLPRYGLPLLGATTLSSLVLALVGGLDAAGPQNALQMTAAVAITIAWIACVAEPVVRFWRTANGRPVVQRARLRALSGGYACVLILALTARPSEAVPALLLGSRVVAMLVVPMLWVAFEPPAWLRRAWRTRERITRTAVESLLRYAEDAHDLAGRGIEWAHAIVGGVGSAIVDEHGRSLADEGLNEGDFARAAAHPSDGAGLARLDDGAMIVVPVPLSAGSGRLIVKAGPFTPLIGASEIEELTTLAGTLGLAIDRVRVTAAHHEQSEHYAGLVHALGDLGEGFLVTDGTRPVYANDAYCRLTGYTAAELLALPSLLALAPADERRRTLDRRAKRQAGQEVVNHFESALITKSGERVEVEVSMKVVGGEPGGTIVSIVRDITARKHAQDQMRAAFEREREAVRRLESLDSMKNAFLSAVSHELRTPLTAVLGFAHTLRAMSETMPFEQRRTVIDRLSSNAEKLDRLLADLLDLDRLSRGIIEPNRRSVDLAGLVRNVAREFHAMGGREVVLDLDPVVAEVDRAQIERVVENLLTNAARHTPPDATIWAKVRREPDGAVLSVEDSGPGVPEEVRSEIFEPFRQGPLLNAHSPGVGIGLSLVRHFVLLHGGRVDVSSRAGGGASFRVVLPAAADDAPRAPRAAHVSRRSTPTAERPHAQTG